MQIRGQTQLLPIIGHPVSKVFCPPVFNQWFAKNGHDAVMIPIDVEIGQASLFFDLMRRSPNMIGCSVTFPHKQVAFAELDACTDRAARLQTTNTVRRDSDGLLVGDTTDGQAMLSAMRTKGFDPSGKTVQLIGAGGGSGIAIADALCSAGVTYLDLVETDAERLKHVRKVLSSGANGAALEGPSPERFDIYVNATTLGRSEDDPLPIDAASYHKDALYCDVITSDTFTRFVDGARAVGANFVSGNEMSRGQVDAQLRFLGLK